MIFLKKFIAEGFKSYANRVEINFNNSVTGIVGPNGAGKSNIVDGIKWVLGEQSLKQLRGKSSEDIVFHGSKGYDPATSAEVTLVFDNTTRFLNVDADTIEVSRKVTLGESGNEYYLNGEPTRLKDIQDIFIDTALSKGSLGIIGQGTVQWFAEAKAEDRRKLFEEAAGIGRYTKRKVESERQLEKATENLMRVSDILAELLRDLKRLEKQATKAKIYVEKQKQLADVEISLLVSDISYFGEKLVKYRATAETKVSNIDELVLREKNLENLITDLKSRVRENDRIIEDLGDRLFKINEEINVQTQAKMSYDAQLNNQIDSIDPAVKAAALAEKIAILNTDINERKDRLIRLKDEITIFSNNKKTVENSYNELKKNHQQASQELASLRSKRGVYRDQLTSSTHLFDGVKAILEHASVLRGVQGTVADLIRYEDRFAKAIDIALGPASQNIVVNTTKDAEAAIEFLKQNEAGTATLLPLDTIKGRSIAGPHMSVLQQVDGFLGVASELISYEPKYSNAISSLLGSTIIADELERAFKISRLTYQSYRVVTIDGDVIQPGGAVTGGFRRTKVSANNLKTLIAETEARITELESKIIDMQQKAEEANINLEEANTKLNEKKLLEARFEEFINSSLQQKNQLEIDLDKTGKETTAKISASTLEIVERLNALSFKKDKFLEDLKVERQLKSSNAMRLSDLENEFSTLRRDLDQIRDERNEAGQSIVKLESIIEAAKTRLNESYKMTVEFANKNYLGKLDIPHEQARELVANLRRDIDELGLVNMEAINELEEKQKRYDDMARERSELEEAQNEIINAIKEMDRKAVESFTDILKKVNDALPETFGYLFGGGSCSVECVDPVNVLESGIEVLVNPPGKTVRSLTLLSGGEKTLVALSVLFAMLKVKALPLIIMDEAESALDPANVERFGEIIKKNSEKTQFIVITHRPGTMERCDALYGATMQQKGVTTMLAVTLQQASEFQNNNT